MDRYPDDKAFIFEAAQMRRLDQVRLRLYSDKPLSCDERRDLANALDALMHGAGEISLDHRS
jgi:hypothetical protein